MAILSLDNLSSERFGFWPPIELKLIHSTIHYNSGIGQNAVFVLETLQQLDVDEGLSRVLVSCHTRELAFQISNRHERFCKFMPSMKGSAFYESIPLKRDIDTIKNGKPQIIVATPGRLFDLVKKKHRISSRNGRVKDLKRIPQTAHEPQIGDEVQIPN